VAKQLGNLADHRTALDWHFFILVAFFKATKARAVLRFISGRSIFVGQQPPLAERCSGIAAEEGLSPRLFLQVKLAA